MILTSEKAHVLIVIGPISELSRPPLMHRVLTVYGELNQFINLPIWDATNSRNKHIALESVLKANAHRVFEHASVIFTRNYLYLEYEQFQNSTHFCEQHKLLL